MILTKFNIHLFCVTMVFASIEIHKMGWLDRLVQYHKNKFYNDVLQTNPVEIKASVMHAPPGFKDDPVWDIDSVLRLIMLITESEASAPAKLALRRVLRPTRRLLMNRAESYKYFPLVNLPNNIYYDINSDEEYVETVTNLYNNVIDDNDVIIVSNPVESRLPSAQISVRLLREILEARAEAARPTTKSTKRTIPWIPMSTTTGHGDETTPGNSTATVTETGHHSSSDSNSTAVTEPATSANKTSEPPKSNDTEPHGDKKPENKTLLL